MSCRRFPISKLLGDQEHTKGMTSLTFRVLYRQLHRSRELFTGLQRCSPAAAHTGHQTCKTASILRGLGSLHYDRAAHTQAVQSPLTVVTRSYHVTSAQNSNQSSLANLDDGPDFVPALSTTGSEIQEKINTALVGDVGRLFAVIHIGMLQRKVTTEDLVLVEGPFPADVGDRIRLEKVLMVGSRDFTLTGLPILSRQMVRVEATVIEKTLSHVKVNFVYHRRRRFKKMALKQLPQTVLVINSIEINPAALKNEH